LRDLCKIYLGPELATDNPSFWSAAVGIEGLFTGAYAGKGPSQPERSLLDSCPVFILEDCGRATAGLFNLILAISTIRVSGQAEKAFRKNPSWKQLWERTAEKLAKGLLKAVDFKKFAAGYSVRVHGGDTALRAHLLHEADSSKWTLDAIGRHKEMGHG
jgi:hypothetical protein